MDHNVELLIIGGGCAGLSLAVELAKLSSWSASTLIVDQRDTYTNDRTWCFWGGRDTPYAQIAKCHWHTFTIRNQNKTIQLDCGDTPYNMLEASQFYAIATDLISKKVNIQLVLNTLVINDPTYKNSFWYTETSTGKIISKYVVDTRNSQKNNSSKSIMWQSFIGKEIEFSESVFDSEIVNLMNFIRSDDANIFFTYILPISPYRALVELTVFSSQAFTANELSNRLSDEIQKISNNKPYKVLRREQGILPMGLLVSTASASIKQASMVKAGLFFGAARPATGYAFQRIQQWAVQCANALSVGGCPIPHLKDGRTQSVMDSIFLNVLRKRPQQAPAIFEALFSKVNSAGLIRFLTGNARWYDYLQIIQSLPYIIFLKQAIDMLVKYLIIYIKKLI